MNTARIGRIAEDLAVAALEASGMTILARNLRTPDGEIDLLARDGATIVVVEVKARSGRRFGSALGAVDARKRRRLRACAADLMQFAPAEYATLRFDVVTVERGTAVVHRAAFL